MVYQQTKKTEKKYGVHPHCTGTRARSLLIAWGGDTRPHPPSPSLPENHPLSSRLKISYLYLHNSYSTPYPNVHPIKQRFSQSISSLKTCEGAENPPRRGGEPTTRFSAFCS